jgi:hypothetical protein
MNREKALLVMTLVARRSSAWAHDVITGGGGEVSGDAIQRYEKDITDALAILADPDRGNWVSDYQQETLK